MVELLAKSLIAGPEGGRAAANAVPDPSDVSLLFIAPPETRQSRN
jgi:hypothetical protein